MQFTKEQQKVIELRDRNILVSAAAGSGKTAVLVERIIRLISEGDHPKDIDRLLIVTFTNAAASEMRERIGDAIAKKLLEEPENIHLQKQSALLHNAQITTISSFCLFVLRNNFHEIGLDPAFRVADEGELKLLQQEVLAEVLEELFAKGEPEFLHCVDVFAVNGSEKMLEEYVQNLYFFSVSFPWPKKWLEEVRETYLPQDESTLLNGEYIHFLERVILEGLQDMGQRLEQGLAICSLPDGPYMYAETLEQERDRMKQAAKAVSYLELAEAMKQIQFGRLPSKKDDSVSVDKREMVKALRAQIKEWVEYYQKTFFYAPIEELYRDLSNSSQAVETLLRVTIRFYERFQERKREKNLIDFSDMEHLALDILAREEDGKMVPTKAAEIYRSHFEEILIDEYQDSNFVQEYLLLSIAREQGEQPNRFMVGDVKQSIYKFRLARPELFLEKYKTYSEEDSLYQRIDLHKNFRSRKEVLDGVNFLFKQFMTENLGGILYDASAALYLGAQYETFEQDQGVEMLLLPTEAASEDGIGAKELEAKAAALRIRQLVGTFQVTDKASGEKRLASYRDIVILFRSNTGWDEIFKKALEKEGIPAHITSKTGYFSAIEVQTVLHYLKILDNPRQDIPLCSALLSPMGGFKDEEIAMLRMMGKRQLYDCLTTYEQEDKSALQQKVTSFLERLRYYRSILAITPIHELIRKMERDMGYGLYMGAMKTGEQREGNLEMLFEKAVAFEHTAYHGLFHFIRYMEQLEQYDVDFGEANTLDENSDTVRIMSIHKSKGLEFPICFLCGCAKRFNEMDLRKSLIMDMDFGIGADVVDPVARTKSSTLRKNIIALKMEMENVGEELRILYVALTRAKEKLILMGTVKNLEKRLQGLSELLVQKEEAFSLLFKMESKSYLDFLLAGFIRHRGCKELLANYGIEMPSQRGLYDADCEVNTIVWEWDYIKSESSAEAFREGIRQSYLESEAYLQEVDMTLLQQIEEKFGFVYPYTKLASLYTKTTVSELKKMGMEEAEEGANHFFAAPEAEAYIPRFRREQEEEQSATDRGSAYHKVMEVLDFAAFDEICVHTEYEDILEKQMSELCKSGQLSEQVLAMVPRNQILHFLESSAGSRMSKAAKSGKLRKEQPFVLAVGANLVSEQFPDTERVLVQGVIDVFWEEEDGLVLLDYKTDRIKTPEELSRRYDTQLVYYAMALERLTEKKVKENILYSFCLEKEIVVEI